MVLLPNPGDICCCLETFVPFAISGGSTAVTWTVEPGVLQNVLEHTDGPTTQGGWPPRIHDAEAGKV